MVTLSDVRNNVRGGIKNATSNKPKERSQTNFLAFKKKLWKGYEHTRHHDEIDKKLMEVKRYIETGGKEGIGRLMIWIPPRHGKCMVEGTLVSLSDGRRVPIEKIEIGDEVVSLGNGFERTTSTVTATFDNGVKPVYKVTLASGREISCTGNHPLMTIHGWKMLDDLCEVDSIACFREMPLSDNDTLPSGLSSILGYIIGDGSFTPCSKGIRFTTSDEDVVSHFESILNQFGWKLRWNSKYDYSLIRSKEHEPSLSIELTSPFQFIKKYMSPADAHSKTVPDCMFSANEANVCEFLAAYFNCDGTVNEYREGVAEFYSVSKELLVGVQVLLNRLGIYSRLSRKKGKYNNRLHLSWRLTVSGGDLINMADRLPVVGSKGEKLRHIASTIHRKNHYPEYEAIPNGWQTYLKNTASWYRKNAGIRIDKKYKIGTARQIVQQIAEIEDNDYLRMLCSPDVIWDRIKSIEYIGDLQTYDITVADTHNFAVDGVIVHNTENLRYFESWLLGEMPELRMINTAYGMHLAQRNSRTIRNIIASKKYQSLYPKTKLARDTKAASEWDIAEHGGGMIAAGVGGAVTGHGAKLIIIDDPVKGRAEAESEIIRQRTKDWYVNDVLTRLEEPGGAIIIIQTRWHMDDLSGWILNSADDEEAEDMVGEKWAVLNLPAVAKDNDPLGRELGEALWESKYSKRWLNRRKRTMGDYAFSALYQQHPIPSSGGLFDTANIEVIERNQLPPMLHICRFYDLAITANKSSDYTVGLQMGISKDMKLYVMDIWRVRKEFPDVEKGIKQNAKIDGKNTRIRLEAEKAGLIALQRLLKDPDLIAYTIDAKAPQGDKYTRAGPFAVRVNNRMVSIVEARWNREFLDELAVFNKGPHDDMVDGASGAFDLLAELVRTGGDPVDLDQLLGEVYRI